MWTWAARRSKPPPIPRRRSGSSVRAASRCLATRRAGIHRSEKSTASVRMAAPRAASGTAPGGTCGPAKSVGSGGQREVGGGKRNGPPEHGEAGTSLERAVPGSGGGGHLDCRRPGAGPPPADAGGTPAFPGNTCFTLRDWVARATAAPPSCGGAAALPGDRGCPCPLSRARRGRGRDASTLGRGVPSCPAGRGAFLRRTRASCPRPARNPASRSATTIRFVRTCP